LMDDPQERHRLTEAAIQRLDRYAWDRVVQDIKKIYEGMLIKVSSKRFLICTGIYPPDIGGPSTVIASTVERLREQGYQVQVITYGTQANKDRGVECVSRQGSMLIRYLRFARAVRSHLVSGTIVIATDVYSVGLPVRAALIGQNNRLLLRLGGEWRWERAVESRRFFGTLREFWRTQARGWRGSLEMWIYRWVVERAERVAVTSRLLKEILTPLDQKWTHKIDVIPNQVSMIDVRQRSAYPSHQPLRLIYIGRFVRVKNLLFLARILRELVTGGKSIICTWVGDGSLLNEVKRELAGISGMTFVGTKSHQEIASLLVDVDLFVLPSLSDLYPNAVIEALACGVPVLCTSEHGLSSDLGGVLFISPQDEDAWKREITALMDPIRYEALRSTIHLPRASQSDFTDWVNVSVQTQ
ncbi:MAG: glycosyltransferase family 4 protein, partial [Candidatus Uhrbacteria bacterium]|nr:glycosyltransferase family 4 protein [Candidatus Uhrbacteria bacterium]